MDSVRFQWRWMVIPGKVFDCIDGHSNVYPMFDVVPLEIDAAVEIASPILNNVICLRAQCSKEVFEIFIADVFDPKVINAQIKPDGA
jgi:hypothetical protein